MDHTESFRKDLVANINRNPKERNELEEQFGNVWDTQELTRDFNV